MIENTKRKQKICSRGHKYEGSGPCLICWPGYYKKNHNQANLIRKSVK